MRIYLTLRQEEQESLEILVKTAVEPYIRERCSAILQIANGAFGKDVAAKGLLCKRRKNTVYDWVERFKADGIKGLYIRTGRGRKPKFSPLERSGSEAAGGTHHRSKSSKLRT